MVDLKIVLAHYHSAGVQCCSPPNTEIDVLANKIADEADFLAQNSLSAKAVVDIFKKLDREIKLASVAALAPTSNTVIPMIPRTGAYLCSHALSQAKAGGSHSDMVAEPRRRQARANKL